MPDQYLDPDLVDRDELDADLGTMYQELAPLRPQGEYAPGASYVKGESVYHSPTNSLWYFTGNSEPLSGAQPGDGPGVRDNVARLLPDQVPQTLVGSVSMWIGNNPPNKHLALLGQNVSRTTYPELYALWGTGFGAGDGSTTFALPDMRRRVPVGLDNVAPASGSPEMRGVGNKFGSERETLALTQIPSHGHGGTTGGENVDHVHNSHSHAANQSTLTPGGNRVASGGIGANTDPTSGRNAGHVHGVTAEGGGQSHNNTQPSFVVNFIVRAQT